MLKTPQSASPGALLTPTYARALERLHACMRGLDTPAPHFMDRISEAQRLVADRDASPALDDADEVLPALRAREELLERGERLGVSRIEREHLVVSLCCAIDLAEAVSLSPSACLRRVKALEASGIIDGYRAEISRTQAGLGLTAFIGLKVDGHSRTTSDQVERALMAIPAVVACYVVTGSDDFMVEVAAQDLADYEKILLDEILAIPAVLTAQSAFAIRTVLSRGPVPLTPGYTPYVNVTRSPRDYFAFPPHNPE